MVIPKARIVRLRQSQWRYSFTLSRIVHSSFSLTKYWYNLQFVNIKWRSPRNQGRRRKKRRTRATIISLQNMRPTKSPLFLKASAPQRIHSRPNEKPPKVCSRKPLSPKVNWAKKSAKDRWNHQVRSSITLRHQKAKNTVRQRRNQQVYRETFTCRLKIKKRCRKNRRQRNACCLTLVTM